MKRNFETKSVLFLLIGLLLVMSSSAKEVDVFTKHSITRKFLPDVRIIAMTADSVAFDTVFTEIGMINGQQRAYASISGLAVGKTYLLKCSKEGFETQYVRFSVGTERYPQIPYILMKPQMQRKLEEAEVKATRIKMFYRGDTIIYNADAFSLPQGSMLDALIAELPGVQLRDNGEIFVNGRKVDELMLNGRHFFRGDRNIMLENLPSYVVKHIKAYEQRDTLHRYAPDEQWPYVMDVVMKREYVNSWIANAETAGGTGSRYLGKLFGLRVTNQSQLSLFGNMNNTNDTRRPGHTGEWAPEGALEGLRHTKKAGIDLSIEDRDDQWKLSSSSVVNDTHGYTDITNNTTSFLPTGNVYRATENHYRPHDTYFSSNNTFSYGVGKNVLLKKYNLSHSNSFYYHDFQTSDDWSQGEMTLPFDSLRRGSVLSQIQQQTATSQWFNRILNRTESHGLLKGYDLNASGSLGFDPVEMPLPNISVRAGYRRSGNTQFQQRNTEFPAQSGTAAHYMHRYQSAPTEDYDISLFMRKGCYKWKTNFSFRLTYDHRYSSYDKSLFNLEKLSGWAASDDRRLTDLPSLYDGRQLALDTRNSYYSRTRENIVKPNIHIERHLKDRKGNRYSITTDNTLRFAHQNLGYQRGTTDTLLARNTLFWNSIHHLEFNDRNWKYRGTIDYSIEHSAPSLTYRVGYSDDSDPLNIILANPRLKNTETHQVKLRFSRDKMKHSRNLNTELTYRAVRHALAMGYVYDVQTGVRTTQPDNVDGNWGVSGATNFSGAMGKDDHWVLSTHTLYGYGHNVDLVGTSDGLGVERSVVNTWTATESADLKYYIGRHNVGVKARALWTNIQSARQDFHTMNVVDFNYGLSALWRLPWLLELGTDLTMYSRRGYESREMNTDDLVWNARLSRTVGNHFTVTIDGFDILGQLSNVVRSVNAQGRTETRYNVMPRYAMLHLLYRTTIKKNKGKNP